MTNLEATMSRAFDGVNAFAPNQIMSCWSRDGVCDNPSVGPVAAGVDAGRACMAKLCDGVRSRVQQPVVDGVTVGEDHVVAVWHVEPRKGARGAYVAEFDARPRLSHVVVYPRG